MRGADTSMYEILFDQPEGEYSRAEVGGIRTRTIRAGETIEVECYPITVVGAAAREEARRRRTSPAQRIVNRRRAEVTVRRLLEANFTQRDWVCTYTWDYGAVDRDRMSYTDALAQWEAEKLPRDEAEARRAFGNYLRRLRKAMARAEAEPAALKYLYVLESTHEPRDEDPRPLYPHFHFHAVIQAPGLSREAVKALWTAGTVRADEFDRRGEGAARLARYLTKARATEQVAADGRRIRRWARSKNLVEPEIRESCRKVSRRRAAQVAEDVRQWGREIFEAIYPGFRCVEDPVVRYSDFVAGAYITARLRKRE